VIAGSTHGASGRAITDAGTRHPAARAGATAAGACRSLRGVCRSATAARRQRNPWWSMQPRLPDRGNGAWLQIALRNLLDNACVTPVSARIEVHLARSGDDCVITVADTVRACAGMRSQLSARFVRGEVEEEGCGLGLSIVRPHRRAVPCDVGTGRWSAARDGGTGLPLRFASAAPQSSLNDRAEQASSHHSVAPPHWAAPWPRPACSTSCKVLPAFRACLIFLWCSRRKVSRS